ncbi:MAG: hypothetical protein L0332_22050 [Chloroflexi bacterium]|nr:hypothetical protein [Chloroflexota bacterium]MCI0576480.1 hypothetical protein [Chloroflexota bacterium]MCI0649544.1 hypothetical protein [Chloroflexota bacterium]MCI0729380.1 hypothetical protein [Chloroflexota bacterium]
MNTLSRAITAQLFDNPETYHSLRRQWSQLMRSERRHELSAAHHLLYLALLGKDWRKGFTPVTNPRKLANGAFQGWTLFRALTLLHVPACESWLLAPFDGVVTPEMLQQVRRLVPARSPYQYRPEQFAPAAFPFDAYLVPETAPVGEGVARA